MYVLTIFGNITIYNYNNIIVNDKNSNNINKITSYKQSHVVINAITVWACIVNLMTKAQTIHKKARVCWEKNENSLHVCIMNQF